MNVTAFLSHYEITENPFQAEEARHDAVFARVEMACLHPDFPKILGGFERPSSAIVFGERGSGKTAIRLQIEDLLAEHNRAQPENRCLPLIYDDLNPALDRFGRRTRAGSPSETLNQFHLVDHIDAQMNSIVPRLVDRLLGDSSDPRPIVLDEQPAKRLRSADRKTKLDLLALQLCYDRPEVATERTRRLKRAIRFRSFNPGRLFQWITGLAAVLTLVAAGCLLFGKPTEHVWLWKGCIGLLALFTLAMGVRTAWSWWLPQRAAVSLSKQLRVLDRSPASIRAGLMNIHPREFAAAGLPRTNNDELRYAMFPKLLNVLRRFGYRSIMVLVDRVDEPTMINGEPERMRAFVWPLLNNKFLQQDRVGVKMLLPLELRYLLNRESSEFFRQARLDKQNLIERLTWSGPLLYDLCTARLNACRPSTAAPMSLRELFDSDVTQPDLVDALDQMQQPRDAFKFIYQVIHEYCSNVAQEQAHWKIPKPLLDTIRKQQVERVTSMLRGVRAG